MKHVSKKFAKLATIFEFINQFAPQFLIVQVENQAYNFFIIDDESEKIVIASFIFEEFFDYIEQVSFQVDCKQLYNCVKNLHQQFTFTILNNKFQIIENDGEKFELSFEPNKSWLNFDSSKQNYQYYSASSLNQLLKEKKSLVIFDESCNFEISWQKLTVIKKIIFIKHFYCAIFKNNFVITGCDPDFEVFIFFKPIINSS